MFSAYVPYLLPMIVLGINEIFANNPKLAANSLIQFIYQTIMGALKGAIGSNPIPPSV